MGFLERVTTRKVKNMEISTRMENIDIDKLIPYARNSRTHSKEQILKLRSSIREFGFVNPVLVDGKYNIIAGHGRVIAAKEEGIESVPCVFIEHLTEAQKKAYIIADNRLALDAGWDMEMLKIEIEDLKCSDFNIDVIGFGQEELETLLIDVDDFSEGFSLPDGDKAPFQQITFTLADDQAKFIKEMIIEAKENNTCETFGNENSNGNAIYRMVEEWAEQRIL